MLYLIPAWYRDAQWSEKEQYWYIKRNKTEFDDTVKQMQLFHRNRFTEYKIILLGYSPNFRHFLHRQSVLRAPYWSCFDAIQEVKRKKSAMFSFNQINWPVGTEFVYTPFVVLAYLHGEKYAKVEFGEDGNLIQIDMYEKGILCRQNFYDDRGFVSGSIVYKEGEPVYQDYLMENGIWKARVYFEDGHVVINQNYPNYRIFDGVSECYYPFANLYYVSLDQVIEEVLRKFLENTEQEDCFCVAMHRHHTKVLTAVLSGRRTIVSFFGNRYEHKHEGLMKKLLSQAGYVIADSEDTLQQIRNDYGEYLNNIMYISPFDSRVDFGISQQLTVKKILVPVDNLPEFVLRSALSSLTTYLQHNQYAQVHLLTRSVDQSINNRCMEMIHEIVQKVQEQAVQVDEVQELTAEFESTRPKELEERFFVENCVDELSVSRCMREQRVLVDLREVPNDYLQIVAISMGIPQIVRKASQFVKHGKNGWILSELSELLQATSYYLDGLENWNAAMVASYELGKEFSTEVLIEKWKEVLASFE